jgi:hypothetical protein
MSTPVWDDRLISRARAADLCGEWPLVLDIREDAAAYLRCARCDGNVLLLPRPGRQLSVDGLIAAAVRHMTMSHDYSLSGVPND